MKVYVLTWRFDKEPLFFGVFSTRELAEQYKRYHSEAAHDDEANYNIFG